MKSWVSVKCGMRKSTTGRGLKCGKFSEEKYYIKVTIGLLERFMHSQIIIFKIYRR